MPNGGYGTPEQWTEIEQFFDGIGPTLTQFAESHRLKIEKYTHEAPMWSFLFRHPRGGVGKIDVYRAEDDRLRIWAYWWRDAYREAKRYWRAESVREEMPAAELAESSVLRSTLQSILEWDEASLEPAKGEMTSWHQYFTEEQFDALVDEYPEPRI